ncbi:uncharacterized protein GBIM_08837 [Gryllus bimaculatus]|nr:uncharacterized protein GBIM_08837 [Gryllus bimaculatus]
MSTPVIFFTTSGTFETISRTSDVSLDAPTSPFPEDTIVIFLAFDIGAETSAATLGMVFKSMSIIAAFSYSFHASAFFAICSASAFAFASIAKASASPLIFTASASASASRTTRFFIIQKSGFHSLLFCISFFDFGIPPSLSFTHSRITLHFCCPSHAQTH